ncbi:DUF790 family protein [Candidatus Bathyarchaeota archaeon]|nr:DUF790 family protein [Candidatus Bathyarchaeota archaeon]
MILSKENIRVFRRKGALYPQFLGEDYSIAKTLIAVYEDHLGESRRELEEALKDCEDLGYSYKIVRGLAEVLDSRSDFHSESAIPPIRARELVFMEAAGLVVTNEDERTQVLGKVANELGVSIEELDNSLYADLEQESKLVEFNPPSPEELVRYYNYSLVIALLAYATRVEARHQGSDEYLVNLALNIGKVESQKILSSTKLIIELEKTKRVQGRGYKLDDFLSRLMENDDWFMRASIRYPKNRRITELEISSREHDKIIEKDPFEKEFIIDLGSDKEPLPKKKSYPDLIIIEDIARRKGITESRVLEQIEHESVEYKNLGGVLITLEKLRDLRELLGGVETLGEAQEVLKQNDVRNFLPVIESLGYMIEWRKPRDQSRIYKL